MIRHMERGKLLTYTLGTNQYNEQLPQWIEQQQPLEIAITIASGSTEIINNILSTTSTHIGLTMDSRVKEKDKIVLGNITYIVDFVAKQRRYYQLNLTMEKAYE